MKHTIIALLLLTASCTKKDKCYICEVNNNSTKFGTVKQSLEHCGSKQSLQQFINDNTDHPRLVDIDSNGNKLYNSITINCK